MAANPKDDLDASTHVDRIVGSPEEGWICLGFINKDNFPVTRPSTFGVTLHRFE